MSAALIETVVVYGKIPHTGDPHPSHPELHVTLVRPVGSFHYEVTYESILANPWCPRWKVAQMPGESVDKDVQVARAIINGAFSALEAMGLEPILDRKDDRDRPYVLVLPDSTIRFRKLPDMTKVATNA